MNLLLLTDTYVASNLVLILVRGGGTEGGLVLRPTDRTGGPRSRDSQRS